MPFDPTFPATPYNNRNSVGFFRYQHPYHSDSDLDTYHHRYILDIPPSVPISLQKLKSERLKCDKNLGWSIDWATAFIVNHLDPANSPDARDTLKKLCSRAVNLANQGQGESVPYRLFNHLNQALFAGHLKDAVYLDVKSLGSDVSGATYGHGQGPNRRVRRISIFINRDVHQHARGIDILASLIHHMIHAYFLVACGPQDEKEVAYGRLGHGMHFAKVMKTIRELTGGRRGSQLPLGFGHRMVLKAFGKDLIPRPIEKSWYRSYCHSDVPILLNGDIEKYYRVACKPLLELPDTIRTSKVLVFNKDTQIELKPRGQTTLSTDSVEFLIDKKATSVLVPNDNIDAFVSVRRAFELAKCRYLEIHEEVSKDGFIAMLELLHTGAYGPDPAPVAAGGRQGPPVIKPTRLDSPPYLLRSVRVFKTGHKMGFEDLIGNALARLRSQYVTHEDPIAVLQEMYEGKDPHPELRAWTRDFLLRAPSSDGEWGLGRNDLEPPNLVKLKHEMCFKERFVDLLEHCSALHIDVLKAEELLIAAGRASPPRSILGGSPGILPPHFSPPPIAVGVGVGVGVGLPPRGIGWREGLDEYERYREERDAVVYAARFGIGMGERYDDPVWPY